MVSGGEGGKDSDLAAVEHAVSDAVVCLDMGLSFGPAAGSGQGACAVGKDDAPQPGADLVAVGGVRDEVRGQRDVFDLHGAAGRHGVEQRQEVLAASLGLPGAELKAREVDHGFEGVDRCPCGQGVAYR